MNRLLAIVLRHAFALALVNASIVIAVFSFKWFTASETWVADAKLTLPDASANLTVDLGPLGSLENVAPNFSNQINPLKLQIAILQSDEVMSRALSADPERESFESLSDYKSLFTMSIADQAPIILLSSKGNNPDAVEARLDNLLKVYQSRLGELRLSNSQTINLFNQDKLTNAKRQLQIAQDELADYQSNTGLIDPDVQVQSLVSSISSLEDEFILANSEARALQERTRILVDRLGLAPDEAVEALGLDENEGYNQIRERLVATSIQLNEALAKYTPSHPQVLQLSALQDKLQIQLRRYVDGAGIDLQPSIDPTFTSGAEGQSELIQEMLIAESASISKQKQAEKISEEIINLKAELQSIPQAKNVLLELQRNYEVADSIYKGLVAQAQQANIDSFSSYPIIQVLDPPSLDPDPLKPNLGLIIVNALLAMFFASLSTIFLLESRDPLLAANDLKDFNFPVVVTVPNRNVHDLKERSVEFQWLATTVSSSYPHGTSIVISGDTQNEESIYVSLGIASALSLLGNKVLIIDLTSCLQEIRHMFSVPNELQADIPISLLPQVEFLSILNSSHDFSSEFIAQGKFNHMLERMIQAGAYDYVLINSLPLTQSNKSFLIVKTIGKILYVIRSGHSKKNLVLQSLMRLSQQNVEIPALIVNSGCFPDKKFARLSNRSSG